MNTQTLTAALRELEPTKLDWKFALFGTRKGRDGIELDWYLCQMQGIKSWVEILKKALLKKPVADKPVADYSPFLSDKENIGVLERNSDLIRDSLTDILLNIKNGQEYEPDVFVSDKPPAKIAGFAFFGELEVGEKNVPATMKEMNSFMGSTGFTSEQILLLKLGNPFLSKQKSRLCTTSEDGIITSAKPLLKFTEAVDFILIGDFCYILSSNVERIFELENRHIALAVKCLETVADSEIISNFEKLEEVIMSVKNAKKFVDFNEEILEHIVRLEVAERAEFLATYGIMLDCNGAMDTCDSEQCELIIDLLCNRSAIDPLGRLVTASNITPRE
ncbi:MAG: DUF4868 domain-containing protein [Oscillospiraceae bacterium]|nr:DUF4868 domain-containing protein [Oscillospiraceae bacterium]